MPSNLSDKLQGIHEQRKGKYGDAYDNGKCVGRMWAAMLEVHYKVPLEDLPPEMVHKMMVAFKIHRMVIDPVDDDHYDDAGVYGELARQSAKRDQILREEKIAGSLQEAIKKGEHDARINPQGQSAYPFIKRDHHHGGPH